MFAYVVVMSYDLLVILTAAKESGVQVLFVISDICKFVVFDVAFCLVLRVCPISVTWSNANRFILLPSEFREGKQKGHHPSDLVEGLLDLRVRRNGSQ